MITETRENRKMTEISVFPTEIVNPGRTPAGSGPVPRRPWPRACCNHGPIFDSEAAGGADEVRTAGGGTDRGGGGDNGARRARTAQWNASIGTVASCPGLRCRGGGAPATTDRGSHAASTRGRYGGRGFTPRFARLLPCRWVARRYCALFSGAARGSKQHSSPVQVHGEGVCAVQGRWLALAPGCLAAWPAALMSDERRRRSGRVVLAAPLASQSGQKGEQAPQGRCCSYLLRPAAGAQPTLSRSLAQPAASCERLMA
jgi:hypothetical protein